MPLLQVRDLPQDLYETLSRVAEEEHRSVAQQTIVLLRKALGLNEERIRRRKRILAEIEAGAPRESDNMPDPAVLIREDRDR